MHVHPHMYPYIDMCIYNNAHACGLQLVVHVDIDTHACTRPISRCAHRPLSRPGTCNGFAYTSNGIAEVFVVNRRMLRMVLVFCKCSSQHSAVGKDIITFVTEIVGT